MHTNFFCKIWFSFSYLELEALDILLLGLVFEGMASPSQPWPSMTTIPAFFSPQYFSLSTQPNLTRWMVYSELFCTAPQFALHCFWCLLSYLMLYTVHQLYSDHVFNTTFLSIDFLPFLPFYCHFFLISYTLIFKSLSLTNKLRRMFSLTNNFPAGLPTPLNLGWAAQGTWLQDIPYLQDLNSRFVISLFFKLRLKLTPPLWLSKWEGNKSSSQDIDSENAEEDEFYDQEPLPVLGRCKAIYTFEGNLQMSIFFLFNIFLQLPLRAAYLWRSRRNSGW